MAAGCKIRVEGARTIHSHRILVVDDHDSTRRAVRHLLENRGDWEVCGEASDGRQAVETAVRLRPDLIVMDVIMPAMNGLQAADRISKALPETQVILFSLSASRELIPHQKTNIRGLVSKTTAATDLPKAISAVFHGHTFFPDDSVHGPHYL